MTKTPRWRPRSYGPVGLGPDPTTTSAGTPAGTLGVVTNLARFLRDPPPGIATRDLEGEPA